MKPSNLPENIETKDALKKVTKYCSYQDRCVKEVQNKLETFLLDFDQQEVILNYLITEKYLDEARYTTSIVRGKFIHKHWGKTKIIHFLNQKEIEPSLIDSTIENEISDKEYKEIATKLVQTKWRSSKEETDFEKKQKVLQSLYQKGYESSLILDIIDQLPPS